MSTVLGILSIKKEDEADGHHMVAMVGQDVDNTRPSTHCGSSALGKGWRASPWKKGHNSAKDSGSLTSTCLRK